MKITTSISYLAEPVSSPVVFDSREQCHHHRGGDGVVANIVTSHTQLKLLLHKNQEDLRFFFFLISKGGFEVVQS